MQGHYHKDHVILGPIQGSFYLEKLPFSHEDSCDVDGSTNNGDTHTSNDNHVNHAEEKGP